MKNYKWWQDNERYIPDPWDEIAKFEQELKQMAITESALRECIEKLERENASLRAVATKLIENNGGSVLQLEEQMERDSVDDYILIKLQDFEALCAAIDAARKEQREQKIKQMTDAASLDIGHSCLSGDKWMRGDPI